MAPVLSAIVSPVSYIWPAGSETIPIDHPVNINHQSVNCNCPPLNISWLNNQVEEERGQKELPSGVGGSALVVHLIRQFPVPAFSLPLGNIRKIPARRRRFSVLFSPSPPLLSSPLFSFPLLFSPLLSSRSARLHTSFIRHNCPWILKCHICIFTSFLVFNIQLLVSRLPSQLPSSQLALYSLPRGSTKSEKFTWMRASLSLVTLANSSLQ